MELWSRSNKQRSFLCFLFVIIIAMADAKLRQLLTIKADVESSRYCKNECIDKKYNFCPTNIQLTEGTCCTDVTCLGKVDICSKEVDNMPLMAYHACPKENWCGDYIVMPSSDG